MLGLVDPVAAAESPSTPLAADCVRSASEYDGTVGPGSLDAVLGVTTCLGAAGAACATLTVRAW